MEQSDCGAAQRSDADADEEGPAQAKVDAEDGGLGDAHDCRGSPGARQGLHLGIPSFEGYSECGSALRDIRHGGYGEYEGSGSAIVHFCDQWKLYGRKRLMEAGHHDR